MPPPRAREWVEVTAETLKREKHILNLYTKPRHGWGATIDDLILEYRKKVERDVERGLGMCSRCGWKYGCLSCDVTKALRYYLRQQLGKPEKKKVGRPKKKP